ncbi:MAG: hypothetical protein WAP03_24160 [Methylorubrum rhodinum]|uniref:hypothetical protein n=1 Tax=Methylorubrum rhodinum TaxID=29428 RepID=UPI003BAFB929
MIVTKDIAAHRSAPNRRPLESKSRPKRNPRNDDRPYIVLAPFLYYFGGQLVRVGVTALVVAFCWASITAIPVHTQRILDLSSVKNFIETKWVVDQFGSLGRSIAESLIC